MRKKPIQKGIGFDCIGDYGIILENYRFLERLLESKLPFKKIHSYHLDYDWYILIHNKKQIVVAVSQGAPMAVDLAERYFASGVRAIVRIGTAGSLCKKVKLGDIVIPLASIKDEGTSDFYIDKKAPAVADVDFSKRISKGLENRGLKIYQGISWSTDGRWRETDEMIDRYINSGAIATDMESSALFSFGIRRKIPLCSVSLVSDEIISCGGSEIKGLSDKEVWFNQVLPTLDRVFLGVINALTNE